MRKFPVFATVAAVLAAGTILAVTLAQTASARSTDAAAAPTMVLVHGAWEQASSWTVVAARLRDHGYPVIVPDNPLRTLAGDTASIVAVLTRVAGPIVLVGHSYGGTVITNAAEDNPNVKALVYIAAFAPDRGESTFGLDARVPGSLLPVALVPVPFMQAGGEIGLDLYVNPLVFRAALAHDVPAPTAAAMAAAQRPVTLAALMGQQSATPTWKTIPSWYMVAGNDHAVPPATQRFMAQRARANTVEIDSSHAALVSHPAAVTNLILAAASTAGAPPPPAVAVAPTVAGLRLSPSTFRAARSGPTVKAVSVPTATRVSYTLNVPASVRLTVQRSGPGRKVGGDCLKPTTSNRGGRACTRFVAVRGSFTRTRPAGADRFTFTARIACADKKSGWTRGIRTPARLKSTPTTRPSSASSRCSPSKPTTSGSSGAATSAKARCKFSTTSSPIDLSPRSEEEVAELAAA
jgi:pimeloyl-ACP methyl ester carboxylesterase